MRRAAAAALVGARNSAGAGLKRRLHHGSGRISDQRCVLRRAALPAVQRVAWAALSSSSSPSPSASASASTTGAAPHAQPSSSPQLQQESLQGIEEGGRRVARVVALLTEKLDLKSKRRRLAELTKKLEDEATWGSSGGGGTNTNGASSHETMTALVKEAARLTDQLEAVDALSLETKHLREMAALAREEGEEEVLEECRERMAQLEREAEAMRRQTLLVEGPADEGDAFLEIQAGAGGRESGDWVEMLLRMYEKWARGKGFEVSPVQETWGEGGGLRSVMVKVLGPLAHGWCKSEAGVHRLVRVSPFDSNARRHTSFAQVRIYPASDEAGEGGEEGDQELPAKDLRIDTYRSQGAGGQHVNTTDSAVRITHLPTGIVVTCQADRSQHRNKATALAVLRAKLRQRRREEREAEAAAYRQGLGDNSWGNQIRSYVLHPYQMVKDHRTGVETGDVGSVLDEGQLDAFIEAALASSSSAGETKEEGAGGDGEKA